jgi:hypothetical protein
MKSYRIQFFDARDRPTHSHEMDCSSDDDAIERTARLRHRHGLELWDGDRLVWRFETRGKRSSSHPK